jgi:hypothetical protein
MPKRLRPVLAFALVLSAVAAGCGQAGEEQAAATQPVATGPMTKRSFLERADAICNRMVEAATDATLERAIELQGRMIGELRALEPPARDEAQVGAVLLHLDRLQAAMRALQTTEGEEVLVPVAAIGVEMDAVARAAKRYGLFRRCSAYREIPEIRQIMSEQEQTLEALLEPAGEPPNPQPAPPSTADELRRLASALVPEGRAVLRRQDCTGGAPASPSCVTIELGPIDRPIAERRAELARLAAREGWTQPKPTEGEWPVGLLVLSHGEYDATVWLAAPECTTRLEDGDGPRPKARATRCVDTIMVKAFR